MQPHSVWTANYRVGMEPKDPKTYLWDNICTLLGDSTPSIDKVAKAVKVGRGTIQRIQEGQTSVGLDVLRRIAAALKTEVWLLLRAPEEKDSGLDFRTAALMAAYACEDEAERELLVTFIHEISKKLEKMNESARTVKVGTPP